MASLSTLIGNLTQASDRPTLEPRFNTGEIPIQDDFYALIHSPLSRVDDGVFKTLDNPLCIQSADGDSAKNVLHFYDDNISDPIWELTIENDDLNINNASGDLFTFGSNGNFTLKDGDLTIQNGSLSLAGSGASLSAPRLEVGVGTASHIRIIGGSGIYIDGGEIRVEDADLSLRQGGFHRWRIQTDNDQVRFRNVYSGSGVLQNDDFLILEDDGSVHVPEGPIVSEWKHTNGASLEIDNKPSSITSGGTWSNSINYGARIIVGTNSSEQKYGIVGSAGGDNGVKYGVIGFADGTNSTKYGVYGYAGGSAGTKYSGYFTGTSGNRFYVSGNVGIGTTNPGNDRLDVRGRAYASNGWQTTNADYGELFEASGGKTIPQGTAVTFTRGGRIRPAKEGETPFGIVTKNSAVVGNSYREWPGKYERDEFGNLIMEEADEYEERLDLQGSGDGDPIMVKTGNKIQQPVISKNYNAKKKYVPREDRPEWCMVGLLGQLRLKKGQPIADSWVRIKKISDELELWLVK